MQIFCTINAKDRWVRSNFSRLIPLLIAITEFKVENEFDIYTYNKLREKFFKVVPFFCLYMKHGLCGLIDVLTLTSTPREAAEDGDLQLQAASGEPGTAPASRSGRRPSY